MVSAGVVGSRSPSSGISGVSHSAGGKVVVGSMPELVLWGAHISRQGKMDHIQTLLNLALDVGFCVLRFLKPVIWDIENPGKYCGYNIRTNRG